MSTSAYFSNPASLSGDDDDLTFKQRLAQVVSPQPATALVPSPPDSAPEHKPGESTPLTGSLARPPQQAIPKNMDTAIGRTAYDTGTSHPPTAQSLQQVQPLRQNVSPAAAGNAPRPASTRLTPDGRVAVVKDLNGTPAGSSLSTMQPAGGSMSPLQPASGSTNNVLPLRPAQPGTVMPANTGRFGVQPAVPSGQVQPVVSQPGLAGVFQRQQQAYNNSPAPAQYAASQAPSGTDPRNPDPNASLRPGGSAAVTPIIPPGAPQQVQAPSQLDQAQAKLANYINSGSGIDQIQNNGLRRVARVGDAALSAVLPGVAPWVGGTTAHNQQLIGREQGIVGNLQGQQQAAAQLADTQSQTQERQALADKADKYDPNITKTVTTADGVMAFNPSSGKYDTRIGDAPDKLNKYQIITAGDGTMFRVDPADPTHAEPITGPDGKQLTGKQESKYIQLERGGVEHTIEIGAGGKQTDLGPTGQKPMRVSVNGGGTWALDEDKNGKPILFNSKTGETKDAPDVQKAGTAAKAQAAIDKVNEPVDAAMNYANDYLTRGTYTGSGDEALQEKFFELAKPSVGFRMTQPQIDLLQNSRSWMNSAAAHLRHATTGTWFSDTQRKEIVQTMKDLAAAKKKSGSHTPSGSQGTSSGGFNWSEHPVVKP